MNNLQYKFIDQLKVLPFVDEIWLFGSRARGDNKDRSDIDLAILSPKANDKDWQQVRNIIDNGDTLLKVDCVHFDKLCDNEKIKKNILECKKVIYKREIKS